MNESVVFHGKIGEVVHMAQPDGRVFEKYRRSPGVRLIIESSDKKILITREFRKETDSYDLRLPGGKVCDSLEDYVRLRSSSVDILEAARAAAVKEAREEVGLDVTSLELVAIAKAGATVEWDLYYFLATSYSERVDGQQLEAGEDIEVTWMDHDSIRRAAADGRMREWQSVGVLLGKVL